MVIYAKIKEKFHGKTIPGVIYKRVKDTSTLKREVRQWNSISPRDHLTIKKIYQTRPTGLVKKYPGIYKRK